MALTGTYARNLDEQHRLAIPKRLREQFTEGKLSSLYIAPGTERSLFLYSPEAFERQAEKLDQKSTNRVEDRNYKRLFYARAENVPLDRQGRIRIPERLMELAALKHDLILVGVHQHAEIWDKQLWEEFLTHHAAEYDDMATRAYE